MPLVQIDETELANLQGVTRAVTQIMGHKEGRSLMLQARKLADPSAVIPEIDAAAPLKAELDAIRAELRTEREARDAAKAEREEAQRLRAFQREWDRQRQALRTQGWTDEGLGKVEEHAKERGIADLEAAAAHWEKLNPPPPPESPRGSGGWNFFGGKQEDDGAFVKALLQSGGENEAALDREIQAALSEARGASGMARR